MVQNLEQLLLRPWRTALGSEIIENQQVDTLDRLKELVVGDIAAGRECGPQVVEEVRHNGKKRFFSQLELAVRDGGRQMCFARTGRAEQKQPEAWVLGVSTAVFE